MTPKKKTVASKVYKLNDKQISNIVLAARNKSGCPGAINFVKKLDKKYKLKKK